MRTTTITTPIRITTMVISSRNNSYKKTEDATLPKPAFRFAWDFLRRTSQQRRIFFGLRGSCLKVTVEGLGL